MTPEQKARRLQMLKESHARVKAKLKKDEPEDESELEDEDFEETKVEEMYDEIFNN